MSERIRAFFALPVPDAAIDALLEVQARMKRRADRSRLHPRWTTREQLHVTLKFLGSIDEEHVAALSSAVEQLGVGTPAANTRIDELGAFASVRRARVLVAHVADEGGIIVALAERLEAVAEEIGVPRETRDFRAHVTLARIKRPGDASDLVEAAHFEPIELCFNELRLYRSVLKPTGSEYGVLASARLGS
jgi:2'-5' RNA ligase